MNFKYEFDINCGGFNMEDGRTTAKMGKDFIENDWKKSIFGNLLVKGGFATNAGDVAMCDVSAEEAFYDEHGDILMEGHPVPDSMCTTYHVSGTIVGIEGLPSSVDPNDLSKTGYYDNFEDWFRDLLNEYLSENYEYGECYGMNAVNISVFGFSFKEVA